MLKHLPFKRSLLATTLTISSIHAYASTVRSDVDYQEFRDFAENKGQYVVGATNLTVTNSNGQDLGVILNGVAMPDFSSVESTYATKTLIDPQYVVTVAHNNMTSQGDIHEYANFGGQSVMSDAHQYNYAIVDDNEHPSYATTKESVYDYKTPRLAKLVTEVAPTTIATIGHQSDYQANSTRYAAFARLGSGIQNIQDIQNTTQYADNQTLVNQKGTDCQATNNCTTISGAYNFPTGSELPQFRSITKDAIFNFGGKETTDESGNVINNLAVHPLVSITEKGDSGSPLFGFNITSQAWKLIAVTGGKVEYFLATGEFIESVNYFVATNTTLTQNSIDEDKIIIDNSQANTTFSWSATEDNNSQLSSSLGCNTVSLSNETLSESASTSGFKKNKANLNQGKTLQVMKEH